MKADRLVGAVGAVLSIIVAGCGSTGVGNATPTTTGSPGPIATTAVVPTTPAVEHLTSRGIGVYLLGAGLDQLNAAGALTNVKDVGCDFATADAVGSLAGKLVVVFHAGKILWVETKSPVVSTTEGARVGMALTAVDTLYGAKAKDYTVLGHKAVGVKSADGSGLFFRGEPNGTVGVIEAGDYNTLEFRFTEGEGC